MWHNCEIFQDKYFMFSLFLIEQTNCPILTFLCPFKFPRICPSEQCPSPSQFLPKLPPSLLLPSPPLVPKLVSFQQPAVHFDLPPGSFLRQVFVQSNGRLLHWSFSWCSLSPPRGRTCPLPLPLHMPAPASRILPLPLLLPACGHFQRPLQNDQMQPQPMR